ncbi:MULTISPECIES: LruC domain-containing protein [unclassified Arcicella]|uniref:LruC domain-containing protein n=1 Tax=unclassified Arcicella TaxID=2644986 RepID=UPI0028585DCB|nr:MULTISPECIES: LruC domain-containing protein [unclassified Arcicella]MDR6563582.1 LruC domain-containing protein [Arcicella sp. BE51]MDR6813306.1 LruC domain-containing protein [Arcicella sp. BE140]MDR6824620.1 LruC domain-containing protein [Arcicella sp. BE139]
MKKNILSLVLSLGVLTSSCISDIVIDDQAGKNINNLVVPTGFNWSTTKDITFSVSITDNRFNNALHVVAVYLADPSKGVVALSKGTASMAASFKTKIAVPAGVKEVYFVKTAPDGTKFTQKVALTTSTSLAVKLGMASSERISTPSEQYATTAETSPDCNSGCDITISSAPQSPFVLNKETGTKTICVTGSNYTLNFINSEQYDELKGGTLRICGTGITIRNLNLYNSQNYTIIITKGSSVTFENNLHLNWTETLKNFGTLTAGSITVDGHLKNYGTINTWGFESDYDSGAYSSVINEGTLTINGRASLGGDKIVNDGDITIKGNVDTSPYRKISITNNGTMTILGDYYFIGDVQFYNNGVITVSKQLSFLGHKIEFFNNNYMTVNSIYMHYSTNTFTNKCHLVINESFTFDGTIFNDSYISVGKSVALNFGATIYMRSGALFVTNALTEFYGAIVGGPSLFKVKTTTPEAILNAKPSYKPYKISEGLQFSEPSGLLDPSLMAWGASKTTGEGIYIPKTSCNDGNGSTPVVKGDSDNDGVPDIAEDYPNDPSKAFNNYTVPSTVAFEDQWPSVGDYDLNDVVLSFSYKVVTNAANQVVQVGADYTLKASGGSFNNGAGIQFNIPSGNAKNFIGELGVGAGLEAGQDSVVVVLFTNARNEQSAWNTIQNQALADTKLYHFSFDLTNGPPLETFGLGAYNPFIYNNSSGLGRGYETHLFGKKPTKLAKNDIFGTKDDFSTKGPYYSTIQKLPWGIVVSTPDFKYPKEGAKITNTYLKFADWASSGGTSSTDWYSNTAGGYRYIPNMFIP